MICKQSVRVLDFSCMNCINAEHLRTERANKRVEIALSAGCRARPLPRVCVHVCVLDAMDSLSRLLFGSPLSDRAARGYDPAIDHLDGVVRELIELLRAEHGGENRAFKQAERELGDVLAMEGTVGGRVDDAAVACKRGILLFALWRDPTVADRFRKTDAALIADLQKRVLPLVGPLFLANLGQRPDAFVALCATMTALWPGEPFRIPRSPPPSAAADPEASAEA